MIESWHFSLTRPSRLVDPEQNSDQQNANGLGYDSLLNSYRTDERLPIVRNAAITYLSNLKLELSPEFHETVDICSACLQLIQSDTVDEMYLAMRVLQERSPNRLPREMDGNWLVFLMISNLMNRGDEMVEASVPTSRFDKASEILSDKLNSGVHGRLRINNEIRNISPNEMIRHTFILVEALNRAGKTDIDTSHWMTFINKLISSQAAGLDMAQSDDYTLMEAITYKRNTLNPYIGLLSGLVFSSETEAHAFFKKYWFTQEGDDQMDILQDIGIQPSPWIPLLRQYGFFEDFFRYALRTQEPSIHSYIKSLQMQRKVEPGIVIKVDTLSWIVSFVSSIYTYIQNHPDFDENMLKTLFELQQQSLQCSLEIDSLVLGGTSKEMMQQYRQLNKRSEMIERQIFEITNK